MRRFGRISMVHWDSGDNWMFLVCRNPLDVQDYRRYNHISPSSMRRLFNLVVQDKEWKRVKSGSQHFMIYERYVAPSQIDYVISVKHSENCKCSACQQVRRSNPQIDYLWYNTETLHIYIDSIEFDGHYWSVNYNLQALKPEPGKPAVFKTVGRMGLDQWNNYAARWQKFPRRSKRVTCNC